MDQAKPREMSSSFSNIEIVTLAVYLLGGDISHQDTEDIAIKVNELAPGRFTWKKYQEQINIDNVRKRLSDAKNPKKGGYLAGSFNEGWLLTEEGLRFAKKQARELKDTDISRPPLNPKEISWQSREKKRMLASVAFERIKADKSDAVTLQEAETFFRLDEYVSGKARERKIIRFVNAFGDDPQLGNALKTLAKKVRENDKIRIG